MTRRVAAEFGGTALLLAAVVGSGVTVGADGPSGLFHHAVAVGAVLVALIVAVGHVSGAHFNPAVTIAAVLLGHHDRRDLAPYVVAQTLGAVVGVVATLLMFGEPALALADGDRGGIGRIFSEGLATGGLVLVIIGALRGGRGQHVPYAVGAYITAAIVFTSSASFANPAVTIGRSLTDTWTGIQLVHVPGFLFGQVVGTALAIALARWLFHTDTGAGGHVSADTADHSPASRLT